VQKPHITNGPDAYRLVHGNVATLPQDVAVNHAWVEEIDFVCELGEGRRSLFSKVDYYKKNKIINVRTYTAQEAITLIGV
jgi:hypothetical protein